MPVVVRDFEVVQDAPVQQSAAQPQAAETSKDIAAAALERQLVIQHARALRVRTY